MSEPADNSVERANPLPPGRYWVVITGEQEIAQFALWLDASARTGALKVNATQTLSRSGRILTPANLLLVLAPVLGAVLAAQAAKNPDQEFFVFTVLVPNAIIWPSAVFGLPSHAANDVTSVDQVEQAPPPEKNPLDKLDDAIGSVKSTSGQVITIVAVVAGVGGLFWLLSKLGGGKAAA